MLRNKVILFIAILFLKIELCQSSTNINIGKTVYIIPFTNYGSEEFFSTCPPFGKLRQELNAKGYSIKATQLDDDLADLHALIVCDAPNNLNNLKKIEKYPIEKRILILLEPPVVAPHYYEKTYHDLFGKIFILFDSYVDNKKYLKLFFPQDSLNLIENNIEFNKKKLCTTIISNKCSNHPLQLYSKRLEILSFFEKNYPIDFDFYGRFWPRNIYKTYKGYVGNKYEILKNYKFCIAYENMHSAPGYITEKIFDVFISKCVPVIFSDNIANYIPKDCYIDRRDFTTDKDLYNFLKNMTQEQHNKYLEAISNFLTSPQTQVFSCNYFVKNIIQALS